MPILESEMPHETMKKRAQTHKCGVCRGNLVVCWGGFYGYNQYVLRCAENFEHGTLTDYKKQSEEYEEGNKLFRRLHGMDTTALMKMDENKMLERIAQARFPADLTPADKKLMAEVSISYGLDPLMQELMIYQGHPYPTINARYRKAQETGKFDGINTRPATAEERKARHCEEFDVLYCAEVWVKGCSRPFMGWGRVRSKERKGSEYLPVVNDPDRQAEKRAEAMGLRKAFSMPVPFQSWEEYQEQRAVAAIEGEFREVNTETGEITEPTEGAAPLQKEHWCQEHNCAYELKTGKFGPFYAHKVEGGWCNEKKKKGNMAPSPKPEQVSPFPEAVTNVSIEANDTSTQETPEESAQPKRDPDTIRTLNELYRACNEDFKLQPAQVIAELGVKSQSDISDTPAECYRKIVAVR